MPRRVILAVCCIFALLQSAAAQSIAVYQTTPDLLEALAQLHALRFSPKPDPTDASPQITVDDSQRFQEIDGFGADLTQTLSRTNRRCLQIPLQPQGRHCAELSSPAHWLV